jgi:septal ring factor EnvC (AmiA/AmiB activator)
MSAGRDAIRRHGGGHFAVAMRLPCCAAVFLMTCATLAAAQDIRGLEICTAEKQMDRRTGCLQANVEFLQQQITKLARETQDKMAASGRDLAAAQAEIAELKSALAKLSAELAQTKAKAEPAGKK